jgi:hypothetical protein
MSGFLGMVLSNLSAPPAISVVYWDVSTASYAGKTFSVSSQDGAPDAIYFRPDGTNFYIAGNSSNTVYQYTLSTPWDVSTASYLGKSFSVSAGGTDPQGLFFKPTGDTLFVLDNQTDTVRQYTLSTVWDVSTASYSEKSLSVTSINEFPLDLTFSDDGTKFYIVGTNIVYQYTLSTAWDISTASYSGKSFSVADQELATRGIVFNFSGLQFFVVGSFTDTVYQYTLSTPWDVSTASYSGKSFSVAAQENISSGIFFKLDGKKMFIVGTASDNVREYTLT